MFNIFRMIDFSRATEAQLVTLAAACEPASFGIAKKDVIDESYRKAGKMDPSDFAMQFSPTSSGIMEGVRKSLFSNRTTESIKVELYKLNVYGTSFNSDPFLLLTRLPGPGSFFKAHVDTPRSPSMVGSLVVVLPTKHEGGSLLIRHGDCEFPFDSANVVISEGEGAPQAAFVAFYSDVEHEVSVVTSGYRVTLTYNLYLIKPDSPIATQSAPSAVYKAGLNDYITKTKTMLTSLLSDPSVLPRGGYFGFGLSYKYPFTTDTDLSSIEHSLKGADVAYPQICEDLNLSYEFKAVFEDEDNTDLWILVSEFPSFGREPIEDTITEHLTESGYYNAQIVYDMLKRGASHEHKKSQPILWVRPLTSANKFEAPYLHYGNEASLDFAYGDVCIVARVLSGSARVQKK